MSRHRAGHRRLNDELKQGRRGRGCVLLYLWRPAASNGHIEATGIDAAKIAGRIETAIFDISWRNSFLRVISVVLLAFASSTLPQFPETAG